MSSLENVLADGEEKVEKVSKTDTNSPLKPLVKPIRKERSSICKFCQGTNHNSIQCFQKPRKPLKNRKAIHKFGKQAAKWMETRNEWLQQNPGPWQCHYCQITLDISTISIDHKYPRGSHPELRHELSNLVSCCQRCNLKKGSQNYERFCQKYYPNLLLEETDGY